MSTKFKSVALRAFATAAALTLALTGFAPAAYAAEGDVAEVNGTRYQTVQEAINSAPAGSKIELLQDVVESVVVPSQADITFDLKGHSFGYHTPAIENQGTLAIVDSTGEKSSVKVSAGEAYLYTLVNKSTGTLRLEGVTIDGSLSKAIMNDGTISSISDCRITSKCDESGACGINNNRGVIHLIECTDISSTGSKGVAVENSIFGTIDTIIDSNFSGVQGALFQKGTVPIKSIVGGSLTSVMEDALVISYEKEITELSSDVSSENASAVRLNRDSKLHVVGGSYTSADGASALKCQGGAMPMLQVSGGTFSTSFDEDFLAYGYKLEQANDGLFSVAARKAVEIDGMFYKSLGDAVAAAKNGDVLQLREDLDIAQVESEIAVPAGLNLTLDLNGHEIKAANTEHGNIAVYGSLALRDSSDTSKNGTGGGRIYTETVYESNATGYGLIHVEAGGTFTMESGLIDASSFTKDNANQGQFGVTVQNTTADASFVMNGGKISAGWYAVSGNGNNKVNKGTIVVNGGILESMADYAIYSPQAGSVAINGGSISGACGAVHIQRGSLAVSGGNLTSKGTGTTGNWGDGTSGSGNAVVNFAGKYGEVTATIEGGSFTAQGNAELLHEGSTFPVKASISGGVFSSAPQDKFIKKGYIVEKDGDIFVVVLSVGNVEEENVEGEVTIKPSHPALKPSVKPQVGTQLAQSAVDAGQSLIDNGTVEGMVIDDSAKLAAVAEQVKSNPGATLETTLSFKLNLIEDAPGDEAGVIEQNTASGEQPHFLDISVVLNVAAVDKDGKALGSASSEVTELDAPLEITVSVLGADLSGSVRLARVHEGVLEFIPCTVDVSAGTITFTTDRFSTYVLLTSDSVEVTFESNGGAVIEKQTVKYGEKVSKPADPTRESYTFAGWYVDKDLTKAFDFEKALDPKTDVPAITLYAKWDKVAPVMHTVTFIPVVGGDEKIVVEVEDGAFVKLPKTPTYEGYAFAGWFLDKDLKQPFDSKKTAITNDLTLYGGWYKDGAEDLTTPEKPKGELPKTGDDSMLPIVLAGTVGVAAVATGIVLSRKKK